MDEIQYERRIVSLKPSGLIAKLHQQHEERRGRLNPVSNTRNEHLFRQISEQNKTIRLLEEELKESRAENVGLRKLLDTSALKKVRFDAWINPMQGIIKVVCEHFEVSPEDIKSPRRQHYVMYPRLVIYALARKLTSVSYPKIGRALGGRDHCSVISGIRTFQRHYAENAAFREKADACETMIIEKMAEISK